MPTVKVLILYDYFTPAYKAGGPVQSINSLIKALGNDLELSVFCSNRDLDATELDVPEDRWVNYENVKVFYASQRLLSIKNVVSIIQDKKLDVLFINGIYSWYFNMIPLLFVKGVRKIVSARGTLYPGALSQKPVKKKMFLLLWKLFRIHHSCEFHATTSEEKQFIEKVFGKNIQTWVAGNFPKVLAYHATPAKQQGSLILISIALISPMKNHLLVLQALKNISYNVEYLIYGPVKEDAYWKECERLIRVMPPNIKVLYKAEIRPDKIAEALNEAHVFILPSKSENFGHALFEAMTAGRPVITSHFTPWQNLQENNAGINVSINNVEDIEQAIVFFADADDNTLQTWSKAARAFALKSVDIDTIAQQNMDMFSGRDPIHNNS